MRTIDGLPSVMDIYLVMMRMIVFGWALMISVCSCKVDQPNAVHPLSEIQDPDVKRILTKAWEHLGGWDAYTALDSLQYEKHSILYLEDGAIQSETKQVQKFHFKPHLQAFFVHKDSIGWHETVFNQNGFYKNLNGEKVVGSEKSAEQSVLSSHFVLFAPFKILDPGTTLKYMGKDSINDRVVEVIRATWNPDQYENHSTNDTWYLHFDPETGAYLSYLVYHAPTYALILNHETTIHKGLRFPERRETWRVDSLGNRQYLRGEFWYRF